MRASTDMLAALDRKRGKGQRQHITVERLLVAQGGAVVGKAETPALGQAAPAMALEAMETIKAERGRG